MPVDPPILLGVAIAVTFLGSALFERTGIPDAVSLVLTGVVMGIVFGIDGSAAVQSFMSGFGVIALAIILFRTGLELDLHRAAHQVGRAFLLALFSFAFGSFLLYCALAIGLGLSGPKAMAISAALGCTSAVLTLRLLARAAPGDAIQPLLALESAMTEALAVIAVLALKGQATAEGSDPSPWLHRGISFLIGGGIALVMGFLWLWLLRLLAQRSHFYLLTLGLVLLLTGMVERFGGSGGFAVLVFGTMIANVNSLVGTMSPAIQERFRAFSGNDSMRSAITESHSQIYFLIRGVFFLYLGILLRWPGADLRIWLSIALAAVALVVGREMAVQLGGWTRHVPGHLRAMLRTSTPRGLTSAVLVAVLIPWLGTGAWVTVAVSVILISNLWMMILSAKLARASAGERE